MALVHDDGSFGQLYRASASTDLTTVSGNRAFYLFGGDGKAVWVSVGSNFLNVTAQQSQEPDAQVRQALRSIATIVLRATQ